MRTVPLLLLSVLGSWACSRPLSEDECHRLLAHYTDALLRSDRPELSAEQRLRLQHEARSLAARDPAFARCSSEVSRRQFDCAMDAQSVDSMERCLL